MKQFKQKYGNWAIVTGASSGIGLEFARQLAAEQVNVVLVARRQAKLETLAKELKQTHQVQTRIVGLDLTDPNYLNTLDEATADLDIGLLINNAGFAVPGAFLKQPVTDRQRNIQLNINAPMELAYHYGQKMVTRGRGGIIFVSSTAAYTGSPYLANYAATKAYILQFGKALSVELKSRGVDVLVLSPGATRTEMVESIEGADMEKAPMPWMNADAVAQVGLRSLGRKSSVIPGFLNKLMMFVMTRLMPTQPALNMFGGIMSKVVDPQLL